MLSKGNFQVNSYRGVLHGQKEERGLSYGATRVHGHMVI